MNRAGRDQLVLAVETTAPRSGAALVGAGGGEARLLAESHVVAGAGAAESLVFCVREVLDAAGVRAEGLGGLAVVDGPGSYTGLRVGLALARGLAFADRLPVAPVGALELVAHAAPGHVSRIAALLDASHGKLYAAAYERDGGALVEVRAPQVVDVDAWAPTVSSWGGGWTSCGDAALSRIVPLDVVVADARAAILARVGARVLAAGGGRPADAVLPRYVGATGARPHRGVVTGRVLVR